VSINQHSDSFLDKIKKQDKYSYNLIYFSAFKAFSVLINLQLATGPIVIPTVYYKAGVILSSFTFVFLMVLFYFTGECIIEALSICNCIK